MHIVPQRDTGVSLTLSELTVIMNRGKYEFGPKGPNQPETIRCKRESIFMLLPASTGFNSLAHPGPQLGYKADFGVGLFLTSRKRQRPGKLRDAPHPSPAMNTAGQEMPTAGEDWPCRSDNRFLASEKRPNAEAAESAEGEEEPRNTRKNEERTLEAHSMMRLLFPFP